MGDTKPGGLPSDLCAYCREPFASLRDMYSTAITIEAGGHAWKYAVPGALHRQCCIAGAKQYRQRIVRPTVKDLCALVSALDDAGKREVAKALGLERRMLTGDQVYRTFIPGYEPPEKP